MLRRWLLVESVELRGEEIKASWVRGKPEEAGYCRFSIPAFAKATAGRPTSGNILRPGYGCQ